MLVWPCGSQMETTEQPSPSSAVGSQEPKLASVQGRLVVWMLNRLLDIGKGLLG